MLGSNWQENEENRKITFITEKESSIYEVFSIYQIEVEDYYISTYFENNDTFQKFVNKIKSRSMRDFGIEVTGEDQILTLSTCSNNNKYRIVLHARKVK